jgi:capsular exopolysaccharide synthesis family protein
MIFNVFYWISRFLKYWHLFVAAIVVAAGMAYLKNQYWIPVYRTVSTVKIENSERGNGKIAASHVEQSHGHIHNRLILYPSYNLLNKAIDRLGVGAEIYEKTTFKQINRYKNAAIEILENYTDAASYSMEFNIRGLTDSTYVISCQGNSRRQPLQLTGTYGELLVHQSFILTVQKTNLFKNYPHYDYYFRFLKKESLLQAYRGNLYFKGWEEGDSVIEISVTGKIVERDIDFLHALNDQFLSDKLNRENIVAEKLINFIDSRLKTAKDSLDVSESVLKEHQEKNDFPEEIQTSRMNVEWGEWDIKKATLKYHRDYFNFLLNSLNKNATGETLLTPFPVGIEHTQLSILVSEYNDLIFQQNEYDERDPLWVKSRKQLNDVKVRLFKVLKTILHSLAEEENNINARYAQLMNCKLSSLPEKEWKLLLYERNLNVEKAYYTYLQQKKEEIQVKMLSSLSDNMLPGDTNVVTVINTHKLFETYAMYMLIGLLIPCIFFLLKEVIFRFTVQSRGEVERISGLPIAGIIKRSDQSEEFVARHAPKSCPVTSFRGLWLNVEQLAQKISPISILLTSTEPKDGKTFMAFNLALTCRQMHKSVVIVDLDFQLSMLSKQMGLEAESGVSDFLTGQVPLNAVIYHHPEYELDIIPAGTILSNPSELLQDPATKNLINTLKEKYDCVLFDMRPFGLVPDASYLSEMVDVVLYVVRNDATNRNFFKDSINELKEENKGNIGIVYNDVSRIAMKRK